MNAYRTDNGHTALMTASQYGQLEIARLLLKAGASKFDIDAFGYVAFNFAQGPHKSALQALLMP